MTTPADLVKKIKDEEVAYVDIRFTDPRGKMQHVTAITDLIDEDWFTDGWMFDGSSIAGWKSIDKSDMKLMPDCASAMIDPFYAEKTMTVFATVVEPDTGEMYDRDPRATARKAEQYLKDSGIGDVSYWGPEAEFFLFDDVRFKVDMNKVAYEVDAQDASWNTDTEFEMGNMGHRPGVKGGYFPVNPVDAGPGHPVGDAVDHGADGNEGGQAPPRSCLLPARIGIGFQYFDHPGRHAANVQVRHPQCCARLWQVGDFHAEADCWRQRDGYARQPVYLERRQAAFRG